MLDHPHIRVIVDSVARYRNGTMDLDGLQRNLRAVSTALGGEVPKDVRDIVFYTESSLEGIRFSTDSRRQRQEVEPILSELEITLSNHGLLP